MVKSERSLRTVLFTDIVGSTERAAEMGDRAWSQLLHRFHTVVGDQVRSRRGEVAGTSGDEVVALFAGPARAILAAWAIRDAVRDLGLEVRTGVHMGKVERAGRSIQGIGVHIGSRVAALAEPGEVLVSSTVHDAETGSGFGFDDRGVHALKGVPGEWRLYAVTGTPETVEPEMEPSRRYPIAGTRPLLIGGALLGLGLLGGLLLLRHRATLAPGDAVAEAAGPGIAVLPFTVNDPELERWREGLVDLLSTNLDGARGLRAIDSRTVLARWGERVGKGKTADLESALEVARESGAVYGLVGNAVSSGTNLRLMADIYDLRTGGSLGQRQVEGSPDSIFSLVDRLSIDVLDLVLEEERAGEPSAIDLASITTTSVAALKSYLGGEAALRQSDFEAAIPAYEEAVAADSTFALAWLHLSDALGWLEIAQKPRTDEALRAASRHADRLSDRDRVLLQVSQAYHEDHPDATELGRRATQRYPDDPQAWYLLGEALFHQPFQSLAGREDIEQAFAHALRLDASYTPAYIHLLDLAFQYGDSVHIIELLERFERNASSTSYAQRYRFAYQLAYGNPEEQRANMMWLAENPIQLSLQAAHSLKHPRLDAVAGELFGQILKSPGRDQMVADQGALIGLAETGELRDALAILADDGIDPELRASNLLYLHVDGFPVDREVLRRAVALPAADSVSEPRLGDRLFLAALLAIEEGRTADAERLRQHAQELVRQATAKGDSLIVRRFKLGAMALDGRAAMLAGEDERARRLLDEALRGGVDAAAPWIIELLAKAGRPGEALRYGSVIGPRASSGIPLGRLYEEIGDRERALEAYGWVTLAWADADPELQPRAREAREAIARLRGLQRG